MRGKGFNWPTGLFVIIYHTTLLIMLPIYFYYCSPSWAMIVTTVVLYFATGISITAGYHRLYSHTTYKASPWVEKIIIFLASMAAQGSALRWSFEHRIHHAFVDTDRDPYSIKKGFWYAHILWLFRKPLPIDKKVVSDLMRNPLLVFQHEHYTACMFGSNIAVFLLVGFLLNDFIGAFVLAWWTRLFFLHHSTWFINSLAHTWGSRSFSQEQSAVDNYIISLLTFGEGYHNYHHTFANDYRNGIRWYHFDPTKWLIWALNRCGLAYGLKKMNKYHIKERMVETHKTELIELVKRSLHARKEELETTVANVSKDIVEKLTEMRKLREYYISSKKEGTADKDTLKQHDAAIKSLNKSLRVDWKRFKLLSKNIMRLELADDLDGSELSHHHH